MTSATSMIGTIGEHLVCADLREQGHIAFMAADDCAYDVVLDAGYRLFRVQVKTTRAVALNGNAKTPTWLFSMRRTSRGKWGTYESGDYDILALVALDARKIGYLPHVSQVSAVSVRSADCEYSTRTRRGNYFEDLILEKAIAGVPV